MSLGEEKDKLIRRIFEHDRDIAFRQFRQHHWDDPEIVSMCPDPAMREGALRGFWNHDAEKHFPEFHAHMSKLGIWPLEQLEKDLCVKLRGIEREEWHQYLGEISLRAVNDNNKERER
jgi:hypothetical protein